MSGQLDEFDYVQSPRTRFDCRKPLLWPAQPRRHFGLGQVQCLPARAQLVH